MLLPPAPGQAPMLIQPKLANTSAEGALSPEQRKAKMMADMLMQAPVQPSAGGGAFGGAAQALSQGIQGGIAGYAANGKNFDQGMNTWMPAVTKG